MMTLALMERTLLERPDELRREAARARARPQGEWRRRTAAALRGVAGRLEPDLAPPIRPAPR